MAGKGRGSTLCEACTVGRTGASCSVISWWCCGTLYMILYTTVHLSTCMGNKLVGSPLLSRLNMLLSQTHLCRVANLMCACICSPHFCVALCGYGWNVLLPNECIDAGNVAAAWPAKIWYAYTPVKARQAFTMWPFKSTYCTMPAEAHELMIRLKGTVLSPSCAGC